METFDLGDVLSVPRRARQPPRRPPARVRPGRVVAPMTCVAAVAHEGQVWMAGDSAGVAGWDLTVRADEKVFTRHVPNSSAKIVMGFTTSFRMGQLLRYKLAVPTRLAQENLDRFMCTKFVDAVRTCLKAGGVAKLSDGVETGGCFIVGAYGEIYVIHGDWCEQPGPCHAHGLAFLADLAHGQELEQEPPT